ncbi:hypothetical protein LZC95_31710 [Pendulispora brunnea]|uniref:LamG domain-containing protein n=1 Tax=Pendulispora brunnea TaxID=2905690 RepID=A0ABZ2JX01_9BACT
MKRRFSWTLIFALLPVGGVALGACVGDEPAPVTPVYVERDSGLGDKDATPGDAQTDQNTPWNPSKVGGLFLWLDGADANAVKRTADNRVTEWTDKSPKAKHFKQTAPERAPYFTTSAISDKTGIVFTASSAQYLLGPSFSELRGAHAFAIYKTLSATQTNNGFWKFSNGDYVYMPFNDNFMYDGFGATGRQLTGVPQPNAAAPHLYEVVSTVNHWAGLFDGDPKTGKTAAPNTVDFFADGSLLGASANTDGKLTPGVYFTGIFAEVIVYDHELLDSDLAQVRDYLSAKWQINIAKPDGG